MHEEEEQGGQLWNPGERRTLVVESDGEGEVGYFGVTRERYWELR